MSYQLTKPVQGRPTTHDAVGDGSGDEPTYDELYEEARKRGLKGRSKMSKTELERALAL
jgi:hypothetical protein